MSDLAAWLCLVCGARNPAKTPRCQKCGRPWITRTLAKLRRVVANLA